jgi:xylan 1,4-beta-xylosidase
VVAPRRPAALGGALAAGWLALGGCGGEPTPATVVVSVDATADGADLERVWAFHGYDEINYTTTDEGTALLAAIAAAHTVPAHVRNHFLFNSGDGTAAPKWGSTGVYGEDAAGNSVYDWTLTDGILDTFAQAGLLPFVELGFMPEALSTHPTPYRNSGSRTLDGGCFYPPADYGKWGELVGTWAAHARARYPATASSWLWELWNEPDIGYWQGTFEEYAKLYDYTEAALHQAIPDAPLGGPAVAGAGAAFFSQFLKHCATGTNAVTGAVGTRLDLVSFHAKGGVGIVDGHVQMDLGNQLRIHRAGFATVARYPQFARTPIYITEADPDGCAACPVSEVPADAYRNTPAYGAYEVAMMKRTLELEANAGVTLGGLVTWAFTFPGTPYFAGYRALATNGIALPILGAFTLLGQLAGRRLPLASSGALALDDILANGVRDAADVDGLATLDGDVVQILVWNYHDDLVPAPATSVELAVEIPARFGAAVRVAQLRVDETHGDAYTVWTAQGMPATPSEAQLAALRQAMSPAPPEPDRDVAVGEGGKVRLALVLPRFGIALVTLRPAGAA